uniref:Putative tyrosine kinase n=1 Tax=Erythrocytic necrosis virus TaxID=1543320 RepID=A0A4D6QIQ5_9VIRU|nr:putative tyrosine kinase [Erythrocytic necrosis virus]
MFTLPCSLPIQWADSEVDIPHYGIHISKNINELTTIHFNRKLAKIEKILQQWRDKYFKNHTDLLFGPITVDLFTNGNAYSRCLIF